MREEEENMIRGKGKKTKIRDFHERRRKRTERKKGSKTMREEKENRIKGKERKRKMLKREKENCQQREEVNR